jgi:hypothetical protein
VLAVGRERHGVEDARKEDRGPLRAVRHRLQELAADFEALRTVDLGAADVVWLEGRDDEARAPEHRGFRQVPGSKIEDGPPMFTGPERLLLGVKDVESVAGLGPVNGEDEAVAKLLAHTPGTPERVVAKEIRVARMHVEVHRKEVHHRLRKRRLFVRHIHDGRGLGLLFGQHFEAANAVHDRAVAAADDGHQDAVAVKRPGEVPGILEPAASVGVAKVADGEHAGAHAAVELRRADDLVGDRTG